eukprot:UN05263
MILYYFHFVAIRLNKKYYWGNGYFSLLLLIYIISSLYGGT